MGHYCRICGSSRPNEAFSGKGRKTHVCKKCAQLPKAERDAISNLDDIYDFMDQSHISEKNVAFLKKCMDSTDAKLTSYASLVLKVAQVKPYKKHRVSFLMKNHPELLMKLIKSDLIQDGYSLEELYETWPEDLFKKCFEPDDETGSDPLDFPGEPDRDCVKCFEPDNETGSVPLDFPDEPDRDCVPQDPVNPEDPDEYDFLF